VPGQGQGVPERIWRGLGRRRRLGQAPGWGLRRRRRLGQEPGWGRQAVIVMPLEAAGPVPADRPPPRSPWPASCWDSPDWAGT